jgi:type IV pilus assembly protein PilC
MKFNYQARNKEGQIQTGVVEASSKEAAIDLLQKQGLFVTILEESARLPAYAKKIRLFEKVSRKEIVMFSRQLSIMFKSKIPLVESLRILAVQTPNPTFREKIVKIAEEVEGGSSFSNALNQYPKIFSSFYISMIKAGEASGKLSESLEDLAEHLERGYYLAAKLKGAMIYPALIFSFVLVVLVLMIFFIFPRFIEILEETGQELPTITLILINLADFFKKWGLFLFGAIIGVIIFLFSYYRTLEGKMALDNIFLKIPIIGSFLKTLYLSRFAENLSTLIAGGLPIAQALEITAHIVGNSIYKKVILEAKEEVRRGEPVSSRLARSPEIFPPLFQQMTLVGEKTGTLDKTLMDVVAFYQKETDRGLDNLLGLLEPALIIFLGLMVAGLMVSVLMPLYQLTSF